MIKPPLTHLKELSTSIGLYEHARMDMPRKRHGYCVDDVSRGLILLCNEPELDDESEVLVDVYLEFVLRAIENDGSCHNRMDAQGNWQDDAATSDWWGRAVWGLGVAAVHAPTAQQKSRSLEGFRKLTRASTFDLMALTFAALGAGEVFISDPKEIGAEKILFAASTRLLPVDLEAIWTWPEERLRYSNGSIAQAVMLTGIALKKPQITRTGVRMLEFLIEIETLQDHFSVTPVGGRGPDGPQPAFDQQPIELAAIASACMQAWLITNDGKWLEEIERAWGWFVGLNDAGAMMYVPETGGGYDGLQLLGPNLNQGAESTISMLTTAQHAYRDINQQSI